MRSRGSSLPRSVCRLRARSPPPWQISSTFIRRSATAARMASAFWRNPSDRRSASERMTGIEAPPLCWAVLRRGGRPNDDAVPAGRREGLDADRRPQAPRAGVVCTAANTTSGWLSRTHPKPRVWHSMRWRRGIPLWPRSRRPRARFPGASIRQAFLACCNPSSGSRSAIKPPLRSGAGCALSPARWNRWGCSASGRAVARRRTVAAQGRACAGSRRGVPGRPAGPGGDRPDGGRGRHRHDRRGAWSWALDG